MPSPTTNFSNNNNHPHRFNSNPNKTNTTGSRHHHQGHRFNNNNRSSSSSFSRRDDDTDSSRHFMKRPHRDIDSGGYAKLFVVPIPKRATEDDILPLFEEYGNIVELVFIKDKSTGQSKGYCFVKYASVEEAERAIAALDKQYTFPGERNSVTVRFADEKPERLPYLSCESESLYVAELNKLATEKEIEEVFSPYGHVENIMILRDDLKQSRGVGFVKFLNKDMAIAAISALHGTYVMRGCDRPLIVRFAVPKRKKSGESCGHTAFRCSGFGPEIQDSQGIRPESNNTNPTSECMQPNAWRQMSPQKLDSSSPAYGFSCHSVVKSDVACISTNVTEGVSASETNQQLCDAAIQQLPNKSSNQLVEVVSQSQCSPTIFQSSQRTSSRMQQQSHFIKLSTQNLIQKSCPEDVKQQSSSDCNMQHLVARISTEPSFGAISFASSRLPCTAANNPIVEWSEHTCPDGFKYYYNCITRESRWEKPEELTVFEEQRPKFSSPNARGHCKEQNSVESTDFGGDNHSSVVGSDANKISVQHILQPQPNSSQELEK